MSLLDILTATLVLLGTPFMILAAVGILRLPDLYTRMHAATKSGTLGAGLVALGAAVHFRDTESVVVSLSVVGFLVLTAPVASHLLGRAGYLLKVPLWEHSGGDELKDKYDDDLDYLDSHPGGAGPSDPRSRRAR